MNATGSNYDIGLELGRTFRTQIFESMREHRITDTSSIENIERLWKLRHKCEEKSKALVAQIKGLADGADVSQARIYMLLSLTGSVAYLPAKYQAVAQF